MPPASGPADARLTRLGFTDPTTAADLLGGEGLRLFGPQGPADAGAAVILATLSQVANPDLALGALARLVEVAAKPAVLLAALRSSQGLRQRLLGVMGASTVLGDHVVRHPQTWTVLADERISASRPSALGLREELLTAVGARATDALPWGSGLPRATGATAESLDALRTAYRSALLRLAARDVGGELAVEDVAAELADLAAATLDAALAIAAAGLPEDAEPCRLAVIGMGKCGGRELNYVSDVDVVFVGEALPGGDEGRALRTATLLAEGLIRACSTTTREGTIWPVDAALRPEGKSGPLVRTLASHEAYYRRWAKNWEFQALLKARPVAGDLSLGHRYIQVIAPLVWSQAPRPALVADVQAMKRRVEDSVSAREGDRQLKLAPGGLRDVEFSVQLLQLVHGRTDEALRVLSTVQGLDRLSAGGYVGADDAERLAEAYRFLRSVEHRLQLQRLRRTHTLPTEPAALRWVARSMGFRDTSAGTAQDGLLAERARHAVEVRRLHEKLFYRPLLTAVARLPGDVIRLSSEAAAERLDALGFADPASALRNLEAMTGGLSRRAQVLRTMLPVMLPWFAGAHDPDAGLLAFRTVAEQLGGSPWFVTLLRDSEVVAERLANLLASSRFVADLIGRAPEAVAIVARDAELTPRPLPALLEEFGSVGSRHSAEAAAAAVRGLRRHELLRIACADLLGMLDVEAVGAALSDVADATLAAALQVATAHVVEQRGAPLDVRLAVIGMGRLGGREQGYGSDADVMFVHEPLAGTTDAAAALTAKQVAEELRRLLALPAPDPPLVVDADLRPEGKQGPLTLSLSGYHRYYSGRAAVWEAQALLRARVVAGDAELGARFEELIGRVRWPESFGEDAAREIRRVKARVENERLPRGVDRHRHTKLGPGALADVEWTAQLLQLRHAHQVPDLRTVSTLGALRAAAAAGLIGADDADVLVEGWRAASSARNGLTLVRGRQHDALPEDARTLAGVARAVGYPAGSRAEFLDSYRRATRRARTVVEKVFYA
ncbi:MAG TPA: bifunctional [glutamine synthetase] adenylyltransferase/[glutamine synthetase]-adenylyl-L-tyrosine phosphorylase [Mycobacteriales bacterium]|nr:bifunctional [glutamine synthetase] adenylyltransferase/[glutamine synthetase]-adenylyl-L-tyrosine phosphorylase [Mycobacteriales bacterium]